MGFQEGHIGLRLPVMRASSWRLVRLNSAEFCFSSVVYKIFISPPADGWGHTWERQFLLIPQFRARLLRARILQHASDSLHVQMRDGSQERSPRKESGSHLA